MPISTLETENNSEASSNSTEAGENEQQSAAEMHDDMLGDPVEEAGLVSTTEFRQKSEDSASGDENSENASTKDGDGETDDGEGKGELSDEDKQKLDATFQDSPRFKELINQKNEAQLKARDAETKVDLLAKQVETLTELVKGTRGSRSENNDQTGYQDILQLSDEQLIENFESDPKGFLANFATQLKSELTQELKREGQVAHETNQRQAQEQAINRLYADYEKDNPDFVEAWEKGEVQKFLEENPGNTPISAWEIMKARDLKENLSKNQEKEIQKAVEEAVKKATNNFKVKQSSRTISGGPGGGSQTKTNQTPAELANTAEHGGLFTVLTNRSLARDKARSG